MVKAIINDCIIMYQSINIQILKQLYQYQQKNMTYLDYDDDCFINEQCDFKVKIVLGF